MGLKLLFITMILGLMVIVPFKSAFGQSYYDWDDYRVNSFYERIELEYGTKDDDGDDIDYIYVPVNLEEGVYEVELSDADGDIYEIRRTDYYVEFTRYFGYAGYSDAGILEVRSSGGATFYDDEDD